MANQVIENRRANGRAHIERNGGVGKVAAKMDYANPSFLVQIFGPTPTRTPTEKTVHRIEDALKLPRPSRAPWTPTCWPRSSCLCKAPLWPKR